MTTLSLLGTRLSSSDDLATKEIVVLPKIFIKYLITNPSIDYSFKESLKIHRSPSLELQCRAFLLFPQFKLIINVDNASKIFSSIQPSAEVNARHQQVPNFFGLKFDFLFNKIAVPHNLIGVNVARALDGLKLKKHCSLDRRLGPYALNRFIEINLVSNNGILYDKSLILEPAPDINIDESLIRQKFETVLQYINNPRFVIDRERILTCPKELRKIKRVYTSRKWNFSVDSVSSFNIQHLYPALHALERKTTVYAQRRISNRSTVTISDESPDYI